MNWYKATEQKPNIANKEKYYDDSNGVTYIYEVSDELLIYDKYNCYVARYVRERDSDREYFELQDGEQLFLDDIYWAYISLPTELAS